MKQMTQMNDRFPLSVATRLAALALTGIAITGCGESVGTEANPLTAAPPVSDYTGPAPATADVQSFKINLWDNVKGNNRCGSCHNAGGQVPSFARQDDVNLAYEEANTVVDLLSPSDSTMVLKVAGTGHHCWLESDAACGDILTTWITAWAGDSIGGGGKEIELKPPPLKEIGTSRPFPDDPALFAATVYPLLTEYCTECHEPSAATPQSPFFANTDDVAAAYEAAKPKIDLDVPMDSRLVIRLRDEFHQCWDDCQDNSAEMQAAIQLFADGVDPTTVDDSLVTSKSLLLYDGTVASGGNRYEANVIAQYEFKTGERSTAYDTSGVEPALNLTLSGDVQWVGGWGINIRSGKAQGSTTASKKLHDLIKATGEYSIEAWAAPGNVTQEDTRIISYSAGTQARNFNLGQTLYNYDFQNRSSATDANGEPGLSTADADEDLQATLQHVVVTFDPVEGRKIYVNGEFTGDVDATGGGILADWDDTFAFVLGNEVSGDRQWQGVLRLVSIHNRAITEAQIQQNFEAGVGEKFFLLFSVSHLVNVPEAYIVFEVAQFDSYSYLFNRPIFISLDPTAQPDGIPIEGIRIGVNGVVGPVGQVYGNLDEDVNSADYTVSGQVLSDMGTIIALEQGPEQDEFFLSFEQIGAFSNAFTETSQLQPPVLPDTDPVADIGLRTFDEINATMSAITTVSHKQAAVDATFQTIKQQLPTVENIEGFLSAHQVAVAQLAIEYCNALVGSDIDPPSTTMRPDYFPGFTFGNDVVQVFGTAASRNLANRDLVIDPLLARALGDDIGTQPDGAATKAELNNLIDRLTACGASCPADRTETTVKAVCAAVTGSAAMLIQ